ncbi:MAG: MarR family transcriptional regulator [Actinobacteria bacterium]|nr:MarR family transcriptional regulator [Actinomycetota bacterium]
MHDLLRARLARELDRDAGLSDTDYGVLVHLSEAPDHRLRMHELVARLLWEKSRLSHHVTRMQQRGLVVREDCASDGRGSFVALTPAGAQAIERAAPEHVAAVRRHLFDLLSPAEIGVLSDITDRVVGHLSTAAAD